LQGHPEKEEGVRYCTNYSHPHYSLSKFNFYYTIEE
jgi:hypothetical protein